jgi:DNA-binding transcriptional ArsR family regulator
MYPRAEDESSRSGLDSLKSESAKHTRPAGCTTDETNAGGLAIAIPLTSEPPIPTVPTPRIAQALRAIADETRLELLAHLSRSPRSTQELAPLLGLGESSVSHHLRVLAEAGLITASRKGHFVLYAVGTAELASIWISLLRYLGAE